MVRRNMVKPLMPDPSGTLEVTAAAQLDTAFGHAGFTGTHVVMNKTNKTAVVFLTNKQNVGFKPNSMSYYSPYSCCGEICELVWNIFGTEAPAETLADKIGTWL